MTEQIQREPDGEALNVTSSGSLTAWLENTAIPVKYLEMEDLSSAHVPVWGKIKPACLNSLVSIVCIGEYDGFGRLKNTLLSLLLSLYSLLSQEQDIYQVREYVLLWNHGAG